MQFAAEHIQTDLAKFLVESGAEPEFHGDDVSKVLPKYAFHNLTFQP